MIDRHRLLSDLQRLLPKLETDIRSRIADHQDLDSALRAEHREARDASRTSEAYEMWRDGEITQAAVAWVLACVFVRFMEDNGLLDSPHVSGPGERRQEAIDRHAQYFQSHPTHSDRDYLYEVFEKVAELPAARELFDRRHNPLWRIGLSGDGATALLGFWQRIDPDTGHLDHDFADLDWNTRFLGDLYQDLSEAARKKYALLQTPEFVEEFILDRTLTPAIEEFGFREVRMIDPTCGSGHFLLGAFARLFDLWAKNEPGAGARDLAQRALNQVYGVDVNPYAVAVARFRLLAAALKACSVHRLADAPGFHFNLAVGDSLLHGIRFTDTSRGTQQFLITNDDPLRHVYETEDASVLAKLLGQQYHAVVGNPPYITVSDAALRDAYRLRYVSCYRGYSLVAPFTERFFELALPQTEKESAGFVGLLVGNAFMRREFGKRLIETVIANMDLTAVVNSGAHIPGHGTPTAILFGRHRRPVAPTIRAVLGIRGEPLTPAVPARGLVWTAVLSQIDHPGTESDYISVLDAPRRAFGVHPWSLGGGGASALKEHLEAVAGSTLHDHIESIGRSTVVGDDDAWITDRGTAIRRRFDDWILPLCVGEALRDWGHGSLPMVVYPYKELGGAPICETSAVVTRQLWPYRTLLGGRTVFGRTLQQQNRPWYEHLEHYTSKLRTPLSIAFAFVATHNHFVMDRGGKVFKQSAPIVKLPVGATEEEHLLLLGLLNSSTACFWMKQVSHCKGAQGINEGGKSERWEQFYEFTGTGLQKFPVARDHPLQIARRLDALAQALADQTPCSWEKAPPARLSANDEARSAFESISRRMIALQEELDWYCYRAYGLVSADFTHEGKDLPEVGLGERAFEISMARQIEAGDLETTWFERHRSVPKSEIPSRWPAAYGELVARRIALLESDRDIGLIERPEYKRRWNIEPWGEQLQKSLREWLAGRLEDPRYWPTVALRSCASIADAAGRDADFMRVAERYRGHADFDVVALVSELVTDEAVPATAAQRFAPAGRTKHEVWTQVWDLQRHEDAIDARGELPVGDPAHLSAAQVATAEKTEVGNIPVPPKYTSADFANSTIWRLRGKLDVPKERFVSYPGCERAADPSLVVGWAGWNHLEQARAVAAYYIDCKEREGWPSERLLPLLTALRELLPWVKQWHNDFDAEYGVRMGNYYAGFVEEEARALGVTVADIDAWAPPAKLKRSRGKTRGGRRG